MSYLSGINFNWHCPQYRCSWHLIVHLLGLVKFLGLDPSISEILTAQLKQNAVLKKGNAIFCP